ncbi:ABC transporter permease [Arenivirga flava]|uniref:Uncharacterized protein n=1 Tax=Arenivirga flava TaxID=1930060 RepID=A0AA37X8K1_9MICO|nr:ABC transporter permease [Arenivirga flava]GMA27704.1 hypothetical protein GCM10025874_09570 [Arenivirga flava]
MIRDVRLEFRKMRRLRTLPILAVLVVATAALSSVSLFAGSARASFDDEDALPWAALMLSYTLMAAMTSPIVIAVLASRQTDIEHSGAGWNLAGSVGRSPGQLCRAKFVALGLVLAPAVVLQTLLVIGLGALAGIDVPIRVDAWAGYTALLILVDLAFLGVHLWVSTVVENQLVGVGIGVLGAFLAVFSLLVPGTISRFVPWGYYAVIAHASQESGVLSFVHPPVAWVVGFLLLAAVLLTIATRRLDRLER